MPFLYKEKKTRRTKLVLSENEIISLIYHDIFDYPLTPLELIKWTVGKKVSLLNKEVGVGMKGGFLFLSGREGLVYKRLLRKRISERKMIIARKAARLLSFIPTIKMVAVTGALSMSNAQEDSDIDLLIVVEKSTLWATRLVSLLLLDLFKIPRRRYGQKDGKDKLCLNIWLDETALSWDKRKRNIFTAHEIAQVIPLVNKEGVFERFLRKNEWVRDYWPNAIKLYHVRKGSLNQRGSQPSFFGFLASRFEPLARRLQYWYMRGKITRETVSSRRALFHPVDWSDLVLSKLSLFVEGEG